MVPSPISVAPTVARSMQALAWTSTRLPSRTGPDCGIFSQWPCFVLGKSESVGADDCAVFERDVVAQNAVLAHHGVGVGKEMVAHLNSGIEHHVGQQRGVRTNADVRARPRHTPPMCAPSPISAVGSMTAVG